MKSDIRWRQRFDNFDRAFHLSSIECDLALTEGYDKVDLST